MIVVLTARSMSHQNAVIIGLEFRQVLPEIIELWGLNVQTQVESKKNFERLTGK